MIKKDDREIFGGNLLMNIEQFKTFKENYQKSIIITLEECEKFSQNGRLILLSEELKLDTILKDNHLLLYVKQNPKY